MLFNRAQYKAGARAALKRTPLSAFAASLISALLIVPVFAAYRTPFFRTNGAAVIIIAALILIAFIGITELASCYFYMRIAASNEKKVPLAYYFDGFSLFTAAVGAALWKAFWTYLWLILFFIPGIVKRVSYSQTYFILAENPRVPIRKALRMSAAMTRGFKADIFMLDISFWGWFLAALCTAGIAGIFALPYLRLARVNAYYFLKRDAIARGVLSREDFGVPDFAPAARL